MKTNDTFIALVILFIAVFAISFLYQYAAMWQLLPQGAHVWRQADCMAMAQNYQQFHLPFFTPATYNLQSINGNVAGEFPLFYYIAAQFSNPAFALRFMHTFVFLGGIFAVHFIAFYFLQRRLLAIICALFMFTSPLLVFYGNNFLSDVPALSISFMAWAIFFSVLKKENKKLRWFAFILFAFAGLLKASYTLNFVIAFLFLVKTKQLSIKKFLPYIFILIPIAWYVYAKQYNVKNHDTYYFLSIYPIWKLSMQEITLVLRRIFISARNYYFWLPTSFILLLGFFFTIKHRKKLDKELRAIMVISFCMVLLYIILFYEKMIQHEYYYVFFFIAILFIIIGILKVYNIFHSENVFAHTAMLLLLFISIFFCKKTLQKKLNATTYNATLSSIEFQKYIISKGIKQDKIVISLPDISPNQTLFLIKRKGYTAFNDYLKMLQAQKADFIILNGDALKSSKTLQPYLQDSIGYFDGITIYKLQKLSMSR